MDERRLLIKDFETKIYANGDKIKEQLEQMGEYLFTNAKKDTRSAAQDDYDAAKRNLESLEQYRQNKDRIIAILDRLQEMRKERAQAAEQIETIERANQPVFEQLGEVAYEHLRRDLSRYNQYSDVFIDVNNQVEDIENIESDIEGIQEQKKDRKFFKKIADTGQVTYLKGIKMIRAKTMPRLYREAGEKLTETNFLETTGNEEILKTAEPFLQNRDKQIELSDLISKLADEEKTLETELINLGVDKRADRRSEELDRNIADAKQKYTEKVYSIAQKIRKDPPASIKSLQEYKDFIQRIEELEKQNDRFRENITKLNAAIEVDNCVKQIGRMNENIEDLERRIREHQQEIKGLEQKITETEAEKKKFEEIRGPQELTLES